MLRCCLVVLVSRGLELERARLDLAGELGDTRLLGGERSGRLLERGARLLDLALALDNGRELLVEVGSHARPFVPIRFAILGLRPRGDLLLESDEPGLLLGERRALGRKLGLRHRDCSSSPASAATRSSSAFSAASSFAARSVTFPPVSSPLPLAAASSRS